MEFNKHGYVPDKDNDGKYRPRTEEEVLTAERDDSAEKRTLDDVKALLAGKAIICADGQIALTSELSPEELKHEEELGYKRYLEELPTKDPEVYEKLYGPGSEIVPVQTPNAPEHTVSPEVDDRFRALADQRYEINAQLLGHTSVIPDYIERDNNLDGFLAEVSDLKKGKEAIAAEVDELAGRISRDLRLREAETLGEFAKRRQELILEYIAELEDPKRREREVNKRLGKKDGRVVTNRRKRAEAITQAYDASTAYVLDQLRREYVSTTQEDFVPVKPVSEANPNRPEPVGDKVAPAPIIAEGNPPVITTAPERGESDVPDDTATSITELPPLPEETKLPEADKQSINKITAELRKVSNEISQLFKDGNFHTKADRLETLVTREAELQNELLELSRSHSTLITSLKEKGSNSLGNWAAKLAKSEKKSDNRED